MQITILSYSRTRIYAALLVISGFAFHAPGVSAQVSIRSSATNVIIALRNGCREYDPNNPACNKPLLWAIAMPCDYYVCNETATLTFSDGGVSQVTHDATDDQLIHARNRLRNEGILDDPNNAIPQCDNVGDPTQQRVEVFIQDCSPGSCPVIEAGVEAELSFEVCPTCPPDQEACDTPDIDSDCWIGNPTLLDPDCFLLTEGLGGFVTFETDPVDDPDKLNFGYSFTLPPETSIPAVSEWGLVIITMLLLVGLKIKFGRFGRCDGSNAHRA